jgi:hypothetical protein
MEVVMQRGQGTRIAFGALSVAKDSDPRLFMKRVVFVDNVNVGHYDIYKPYMEGAAWEVYLWSDRFEFARFRTTLLDADNCARDKFTRYFLGDNSES